MERRSLWVGLALASTLVAAGVHRYFDPARVARRALAELRSAPSAEAVRGRSWGEASVPPVELEAGEAAERAGRVLRAVRRLESSGRQREARLASARLDLLSGRVRAVIERFDSVLEESADEPEWLNELGVALLTRAALESEPIDLLLAARTLSRAVELDPSRPEPAFNVALALGELHLRAQADRAWRHFLSLERDGRWADIARAEREDLREPRQDRRWAEEKARLDRPGRPEPASAARAAREWPYEVRLLGERQLLKAASSWRSGDSREALDWLTAARGFGEALVSERTDTLLLDRAALWMRMAESSDSDGLDWAAERLVRFDAAMRARSEDRLAEAERLFRQLGPAFESIGSPLALECRLQAEIARYYRSSEDSSVALRTLLGEIPEGYGSLRGRVLWMMGIVASSRSRYSDADRFYRQAHRWVLAASGARRAATLLMLRADNADRRGETRRSWRLRLAALEVLAHQADPQRRYGAFFEAAQALRRRREPELALLFLDEAASAGNPRPHSRVEIAIERARSRLQLGEIEAARRAIEGAEALLSESEENAFRERLHGLVSMTRGQLLMTSQPRRALSIFEEVADRFEHMGFELAELPLLTATARVHDALGAPRRAEASLEAAVEVFEAARLDAEEDVKAIDAFHRSKEVFDRLIARALEAPDAARAFEWVERSRGGVALERWQRGSETTRLSAHEVAARLASRTRLLEFAWLRGRLVCWVFEPGAFRLVDYGEMGDLEAELGALSTALQAKKGPETVFRRAASLYRQIVRPLGLELDDFDRLVVVPDGPLARLPFSMLVEPRTGRPLLERVSVSYAPSASLAVLAAERVREVDPPSTMLVAAAPRVASRSGTALPALSFRREDAVEITTGFQSRRILLDATPRQVMDALPGVEIFHFSGHALASESRWLDNALLLAEDSENPSGYLGLSEILAGSKRLRLVTLAGCDTLRGYDAGRGGAFGLGMAFFASGTLSVVGTRWPIDDRPTLRLMKDFYRDFAATGNAAEALRQAKLRSFDRDANSSSPGWSWAAFELIGA